MTTTLGGPDLTAAFDHGACAYDLLTAANPGYHAALRRSARRLRLPGRGAGLRLLDLGCGTGASTAALLRAAPLARITAADASAGMLARAAAKRWPPNVRFTRADATALPSGEVTGPYDAVLAAYLVRNVADPDGLLGALRSLLAPGGRLALHEYTLAPGPGARLTWNAVCRAIVRPAGRLTGDAALYRHLHTGVLAFDRAPQLAARVRRAGFRDVRVLPLPGWQYGIVHTVLGRAPGPS